jgi:peptide/nickel transport system substrate-binding protein
MSNQRRTELNGLISRYMAGDLSRRDFLRSVGVLAAAATVATTGVGQIASAAAQDSGDKKIRKIGMLTNPQANVPIEFESIQLAASQIAELGVEVDVQVLPNDQLSDIVWYQREDWDYTAWQMVGRSERLDPDEFIFNLFHSTNVESGYNFVGYVNPEYDAKAEAQRAEVDQTARQQLVYETQQIVATDQPYTFFAYPEAQFAFNKQVFDENTVVDAKGIGIKNYFTFVGAVPLGDMKDVILNTQTSVQGINPLYISGGPDSWVTELIWDRLMRVGADGLPVPSAATAVEWVDNQTLTVTLREGMTWHDGQPVTTDDVIFSFQAPAGDASPMYKPFVASIDTITAEGNVLTFTLLKPNAAFLTSSLSKINLVPKHIWEPVLADLASKEQNAEQYQEETPIGSGPFKYVNWARAQEIILESIPDHYAAPKIGKWILRDIPNVSAALGGLQSGEINFLSDYTGDPELFAQTVNSSPDQLKLVSTTQVGFRFLAPNHRRQPMNDPAFRLAVSMVVGKDQVVANIFKGFASVADSVVSKALDFWHAPDLADYATSDVEGARSVLTAAGYTWDGDGKLQYPEGITETLSTGGA